MADKRINATTGNDDMPLIQVPNGKRTFYFLILYGLFMMDFIARVGINAIFPLLQRDLSLTDTQIGSLASIVLFGMAVLVLPISFYGEKKSPKKTITILAAIWSIGSLLSGIASSFALLASARFLVGAGNSAYAPLSNSLITSMYKKAQWGKMIGIYNTAMTIGAAAGALIFAQLAEVYSWRMTFILVGIFSLLFTVLSLLLPETKEALRTDSNATDQPTENKVTGKAAVAATLKNKALLLICLGGGLAAMGIQVVNAYLSIFMVRECGYDVSVAAGFVGAMALISAVAFPLGGAVMDVWYKKDKRARVWLPAICLTLCGICIAVGTQLYQPILYIVGSFSYAFGSIGFHTATQELVPVWFKSVSYGVYVIFIQFLGAIGPLVAGVLSDAFGLVTAITVMQIVFGGALAALLLAGIYYIGNYNNARAEEQLGNSGV